MSSALIYVIYARVSTREQKESGRSIVDQVTKCQRHIKETGGILAEIFTDDGFSGSSTKRPALSSMIRYCQENDVDRIIIVDTDRLARNTNDHFAIKAILKKCGTAVESINQQMLNDSPEGNLLDGILASVNAFYPQVTGRKTSDTMLEKARSGWYPGPALVGYLNHHNPAMPKGLRNTIIVDPVKGPLVTQAFQLYSNGSFTLYTLADEMNTRGLRNINGALMTHNSINNILKNEFYTGKWHYKKEYPVEGKHTPLIDPETFTRSQLILAQHNHGADRSRKHQSLLTGFLYCGICGGKYTASYKESKGKAYYHCSLKEVPHSNEGQNVPVEELDKAITDLFKFVTLPQEVIDGTIQEAQRILKETHSDVDQLNRELTSQKSLLETRRDNIETKFADNEITLETYRRQISKIEENLAKITKETITLNDSRKNNIREMEQLLILSQNIHQAFIEAPYELRRQYLALFWEKIIMQDKAIKKAIPTQLFRAAVPQNIGEYPSVLTDFSWLPGKDSNLRSPHPE